MRIKLNEWSSRLKLVERQYQAVQIAADRLLKQAQLDPSILLDNQQTRDIALATEHLEEVYMIYLFAEFEKGVRSFWSSIRPTVPKTEDLLNGVGSSCRIPFDKIQAAHAVRMYRNSLVHVPNDEVLSVSMAEARANLCIYLGFIPKKA